MYAVIRTGGKQERVAEGQLVRVERLGIDEGEDVELAPILIVDGERVLATPDELSGAAVTAKVVGFEDGPKIRGFVYKPKSNNRRRFGHRQHYDTIQITSITAP
jgi:large subunit ribosomal protein L21